MFYRLNSEEIKLYVMLALACIVVLSAYIKRKVLISVACLLLLLSFFGYSRALSLFPFQFKSDGLKYTWSERIDSYDLFHYYLNVKYFKELSYFNLYPAMLTADLENNGPHFKLLPSRKFIQFQDRHNYYWVLSKEYFNDPKWRESSKANFSESRWQEFSHDFLHLQRIERGGLTRHNWNNMLWDHGFNGTPAWTGTVHWLTNLVPAEYVKLLCHTDTIFILISMGFVAWAFGTVPLLIYAIYMLSCYSGRWPTISWAFGRFDYVSFLVIATCLIKKQRYFLGGLFGGWAGSLRVFPYIWFMGLLNHLRNRQNFNAVKKIFLGAIVITTLLWGSASYQFGVDNIKFYLNKMTAHTAVDKLSSMRAGFALALAFDADFTTHRINKERRDIVKSQHYPRLFVSVLLIFVFLSISKKLPLYESYAYGFIPFFIIFTASYYYYIVRATLIITHASKLQEFRHKVCLGLLLLIEAASLFLVIKYPLHRVTHIGILGWLLVMYIFVNFYLIIKEQKSLPSAEITK